MRRYGTMSLADVMQPAIRHATRGFTVTPYLSDCIESAAADLLRIQFAADRLLPDGAPLKAGDAAGAGRLCRGPAPDRRRRATARCMAAPLGRPAGRVHASRPAAFITAKDLTDYRVDRARADPRPLSRLGDRRPAAARGSGVHITQMLNILEGFDIAQAGLRHRRTRSICWPRC